MSRRATSPGRGAHPRDWGRMGAVTLMLLVAAGAAGCQKALFPENAPRTQFEAYDIMRQKYTPLEEPDVFGSPRPALRARLAPERE